MSNPTPPPAEPSSIVKQLAMFGLVFGQFVGASGVGVGLGWYLWKKQGFPWWTILATSLLGLYAASIQVLRYSRILAAAEKKENP